VRTWLGYTIPKKRLYLFFDSLAVQLNFGRPISESLIAAAFNSGDIEIQEIAARISPQLRQGHSLQDCLKPYSRRLPEIVICVLEVGEMSGGLPGAAERLSETFKLTLNAERDLAYNAYSPRLILLALCLLLTIGLLVGSLTSSGPDAPILTLIVRIACQVAAFAAGMIAGFFVLRALMRELYRWGSLRLIVDTIKLALPGFGMISRNLSAARWARSFAVLWSAGVNISTALEVSSGSSLNAHYERELRQAAVQTRLGRSLSDCLKRTQLLPPYLLGVISVCETAGRMDDQLIRIAADMERDALHKAIIQLNRMVALVQLIIIIAAVLLMMRIYTT
jgi:type II secretory pathway component PulF